MSGGTLAHSPVLVLEDSVPEPHVLEDYELESHVLEDSVFQALVLDLKKGGR